MRNFRIIFGYTLLTLLLFCCKREYTPQVTEENKKLLVVEGFLNSGQGPTIIHLSRTVGLNDPTNIQSETGAQVNVEGSDGSSSALAGNGNGEYSIAQLTMDANVQYRVRIKTIDGKEYLSDFSSVKYTPLVDSITWRKENDGLQLYVNTHDPQNTTKYYQWQFDETWEFHSAYYSSLKYIRDNSNRVIDLVFKYPNHRDDTAIYKCWKTLSSTAIIVGSSEKLTTDLINLPIQFIEPNSEKLGVLYSINLKQFAVSHEKYLFLQKMKKNTEQLGTLFDAQPSQLSGNIHCLSDPAEKPIGYIEVSQEQTQRIFIYKNQVGWFYNHGCTQVEIDNNLDSIAKYGADLVPTAPSALASTGAILKFLATHDEKCVDCTIGRSNQKPIFWP